MSKRVKIKASPGRVILRFPDEKELVTEGGIIRVADYTQLVEIATVEDIGEPTDEEERRCAMYFRERQERGEGVLADYAAGGSFWREKYDPKKWGWLKPLRVYRLSSPSAHLEIEEVEETA